jgi:hypothetical protein
MRMTFTYAGHTIEGTVETAFQRCTAIIDWDWDDDHAIRCGAREHAHWVGEWRCGHDQPEGVIAGTTDAGAPFELTFPVNDEWSPMLLRMGL